MSGRAPAVVAAALRRFGKAGCLVGPSIDLALSVGVAGTLRGLRDPSRDLLRDLGLGVYRGIWENAATGLGATILEQPGGYLEIRQGEATTLVWRNLVQLDDPVVLQKASDKPVIHDLLRRVGLPVSAYLEYDRSDLRPAIRFLAERGGPVVVKPASRTGGGNGVTCGVRSAGQLTRASLRASRWGERLLIEQQAAGDEFRVLILDHRLVGALRRRPPEVTGDGRSTIAELIHAENRQRAEVEGLGGLFPITIDLDCVLALEALGLTLRSVPPAGQRVVVKTMANEGGAAQNETVGEADLGRELVDGCIAAAQAVGLRLAGVEVVRSQSATTAAGSGSRWAVLEVNGTPGLHYHYQVADPGNLVRVAVPILEAALARH